MRGHKFNLLQYLRAKCAYRGHVTPFERATATAFSVCWLGVNVCLYNLWLIVKVE